LLPPFTCPYTPLIAQMKGETSTYGLLLGVWSVAVLGIVLKLALPGRFDRISIGLYMLLGWSGVMAYEPVVATLPSAALWLIAAGGLLYSAGVVFHLWEGLRFRIPFGMASCWSPPYATTQLSSIVWRLLEGR
jgi:hemolysin III